jgi:protein TonB
MGYYRGAHTPDRWKAAAGVFAVHVALAAVILTGLNVDTVTRAVERLKTFDITDEVPPAPLPEPPPPPRPQERGPEEQAAPANIQSKPTPVVAPEPPIALPIPLPMNNAKARRPEGLDRTAGGSNVPGFGTGAGGQGSGFGGGWSGGSGTGTGSGAGFTPAQRISRIPDREYRRLRAASGRSSGSVGITIKVNTDGRVSNCRVVRSSGDPSVDGLMCQLAVQHVRFRPARDPRGQPVAQDITWHPNWSPNF